MSSNLYVKWIGNIHNKQKMNKKRENNVKNNKSITLFSLSYTLLFILQAGRLHPDKSSSRDPVYPAPDIHLSDASDQAGLGGVRRKRHSYPVLKTESGTDKLFLNELLNLGAPVSNRYTVVDGENHLMIAYFDLSDIET